MSFGDHSEYSHPEKETKTEEELVRSRKWEFQVWPSLLPVLNSKRMKAAEGLTCDACQNAESVHSRKSHYHQVQVW